MRTMTAAILLAATAGTAFGQVTVVSASAAARATAGDGSGTNQQTSASISGATLSATKNFSNGGHASASNNWGLTNWIMSGSFSGQSFAQSQGEAGAAEATLLVNFDSDTDLDVEYGGGYSLNSPGGSIELAMRNRVTNGYVVGGQSPNLVHIPAGQYKLELNAFLPYGDMSGGYNIQFRPGNDRCQFARVITPGVQRGSTTHASFDGNATCGSSQFTPSVWYKWVAAATGPIVISTCGSSYDTVLSVYDTNSCPSGTGTQIACDDDADAGTACSGSRSSSVTVNAVQGETYYIRVSGYDDATGNYQLNLGPVNNECEEALGVTEGSYPFDNRFATTDGPVLSQCTNNGVDNQVNGDLWYVYTATQSGTITIDTCGSGFDTKLALYSGTPCERGRPVYLTCNDDGCGFQSRIENYPVVAGREYGIRVGGYLSARGTGTLNISFSAPCPADFNGDNFLDFFDYDDYVNCFETGTCPPGKTADFNGDDFVDFFDYDDFVQAFEAGC
jgi:hypothetical protein